MSEAKSSQSSEWQRFSPMPERSQTQFGLVSYNVLADVYAMSPISPDLYKHVSKEHLSWEYRRDALRKDILAIGPDVVCMQECDLNNWETDFAEYFAERGFGSLLQNDPSRHPDHSTGLGVLYRRSKFSLAWQQSRSRALLLALKPVQVNVKDPADELKELSLESPASPASVSSPADSTSPSPSPSPSPPSSASSDASSSNSESKNDSDNHNNNSNKDKANKQKQNNKQAKEKKPKAKREEYVWIANCHLEGHPMESKRRFEQLKSALKHIRSQQLQMDARPPSHCATIVNGDFNSTPNSSAYRMMVEGLEANACDKDILHNGNVFVTKAPYKHDYNFQSSYAAVSKEPEATFILSKESNWCLDFIFFNQNALKCVQVMQVLSDEERAKGLGACALPSANHPSDHLPVASILEFVPQSN